MAVFQRGIRLKQHKSQIICSEIADFGGCGRLSVPVALPCELNVSVGDCVTANSLLGVETGSARMCFCPSDGVVDTITEATHPILGEVMLVNITEDTSRPSNERKSALTVSKADAQALASVSDHLTGLPLAKLIHDFRISGKNRIAVNAIEDQPYVCPDCGVLFWNFEKVAAGLQMLADAAGISRTEIYAFNSKGFDRAAPAIRHGTSLVGGKYPCSFNFTRNMPDTGFVSAQTCVDLFDAVKSSKNQTHVTLTVAGPLVRAPRNVRAKIGTPIGALLDFCNPKDEEGIVILGGPMNGIYVSDLETPVCPGMKSVLLLQAPRIREVANCSGCAACARVCPQNLMPLYLSRFARHGMLDDCLDFGILRCIECGCCSFVCTGGIDPLLFISNAKAEIIEKRHIGSATQRPVGQLKKPAHRLGNGKGGEN